MEKFARSEDSNGKIGQKEKQKTVKAEKLTFPALTANTNL